MPRTQADATRFTATHPHAHSIASTINLTSPPPANETPAQKVTRLREAARRAKLEKESTWDKIVFRGRRVANVSHRLFGSVLILSSVVLTGFVGVSFVTLAMENREKKRKYYAEQEEAYQQSLALAKKAEAEGKLTPSLAMFLNKERALEGAEEEKKAQGGMWSRLKKKAFEGLALEEGGAKRRSGVSQELAADRNQVAEEHVAMTREFAPAFNIGPGGQAILPRAAGSREIIESRGAVSRGGPLDQLGEQTAASISASSRWWYDRIIGR